MTRNRLYFRLGFLLLILLGLVVWAWATDRPSPGYPHGEFVSLMIVAIVLVAIVWVIAETIRSIRRKW